MKHFGSKSFLINYRLHVDEKEWPVSLNAFKICSGQLQYLLYSEHKGKEINDQAFNLGEKERNRLR